MTGAIVPWSSQGRFSNCFDYLKKAGHRFRQGQPQWLFNQSQPFSSAPMAKGGAMAALSSPNGHFIKASPVWPLCQEQPNCNFIKASPNGNFIKQVEWQVYHGQPEGHFVQAAPVAILSRQMAVSSKPIAALPKPASQSRPRQFIKASPSGNFMIVAAGRASP